MHVLIGLGNPGKEYSRHRHNIGFMVMDAIAQCHGIGPFKRKLNGDIADGRIGAHKVMLVKPQTFMNRSGHCARNVLDFYKLKSDAVTVFYDELDLAPGKLRIKTGGGSGGHNGIKSLDANIGQSYRRVRLGIGHPGHKDKVSGYVLHDFASQDRQWLEALVPALADEIGILLAGNDAKYASKVLQSLVPTKAGKPAAGEPATLQTQKQPSKSSPAKAVHRQVKDQPTTALGQAFANLLGTDNSKQD